MKKYPYVCVFTMKEQDYKTCDGVPFVENCQNEPMWNMVTYLLLCTAHAMLGLGVSLYWTCGATYLDDNVCKNKAPLMLGKYV